MEKRIFNFGKYSYQYFLYREERKSLSLTVYPSLEIVLKVPIECDFERTSDFLKRKWMWLERQLKFFGQFKEDKSPKEYVSGAAILYLGRQYKLIVKSADIARVIFSKGRVVLYTCTDVRNGLQNKKLLDRWYLKRAREVFSERYDLMLKKFEIGAGPELVLRKMPKRWGRFLANKKVILNPLLIKASQDCIDYVIAHELCHVTHKNHSRAFYRQLEKRYPNWQLVKDKLEMRFVGEN